MKRLSIVFVLSLIQPTLCYKPADYGFTSLRDGTYEKTFYNADGTTYTVVMTVDDIGNAFFSTRGYVVGNGIGSINNGMYMAEGWGKPGIPLSGWEGPGRRNSPGVPVSTYNPDWSVGLGGMGDQDQFSQNMEQSMARMRQDMARMRQDMRGGSVVSGSGDVINNFGQMQGKFNGGVFGNSVGDNTVRNSGSYYAITYTKNNNNGRCTEKIEVKGQPTAITRAINDKFQPECKSDVIRAMYASGGEVLVGGIDQNLYVYGQVDFPSQLIVIENGNCKIKSYGTLSSNKDGKDLSTANCQKVKDMIKSVQDVLENPRAGRNDFDAQSKSQQQLKELVKKETGTTGGSQSAASNLNRPASPAATYTNSAAQAAASSTPKKKHGWLKRIWIFIKNVFRKITGRPIKDE